MNQAQKQYLNLIRSGQKPDKALINQVRPRFDVNSLEAYRVQRHAALSRPEKQELHEQFVELILLLDKGTGTYLIE